MPLHRLQPAINDKLFNELHQLVAYCNTHQDKWPHLANKGRYTINSLVNAAIDDLLETYIPEMRE